MGNHSLDFNKVLEIIKAVDIFKVPDFLDKDVNVSEAIKFSGIKYINDTVKQILSPYSSKYFFEYSLLPSTLDPENEKLYSVAAIEDPENNKSFKVLVEKHVRSIIDYLYKNKDDINFFHNPQAFLASNEVKIVVSFSDNLGNEIVNTHKNSLEEYDLLAQYNEDTSPPNKYFPVNESESLFFTNMTFSRRFKNIIESAKKIYDNFPGELLQQHYEDGAKKLRYFYDKYIKNENEEACYITLPLVSSSAGDFPIIYKNNFKNELNGRHQGIGLFFIYVVLDQSDSLANLKRDIENVKAELFLEVNNIIRIFTYNQVFNIGLRLYENAQKQAKKSAMAAIMSRNISHNLGSHVLSYVKSDLSSTEHILESGVIDDILNDDLTLIKPVFAKNDEENEKIYKRIQEKIKHSRIKHQKDYTDKPSASYLLGLSHLLNYIQERQDYIATIASATIPYFSVVNFKDHILDEFTHDAKAKRHQDSQEPQQNLLLKYIALSEQKTRNFYPSDAEASNNNIEFKLIYKINDEAPFFETYNSKNTKIDSRLRSINVEIPAGIMGRQAFFSILENIIRNTAKHASIQGKMIFEIQVEEKESEFYNITIFTNEQRSETKSLEEIVESLNSKLRSELIREDGSVEESNKGLKEIYISAAWLINVILPDLKNSHEPIVQVVVENGKLGFQFRLFKARKVALIVKEEKKKQLNEVVSNCSGWKVFSINEFLQNTFSYKLYVIDSEIEQQHPELENINARYPSRKHFTSLDSTLFQGKDLHVLYLKWYKEYLNKRFKNLPKIVIADDLGKHSKENSANKDSNITLTDTSVWNTEIFGETLLFKKHLNEQKEFNNFIETRDTHHHLGAQIMFTESITGHNSTERLIRHEQLDTEWWLKMVESSLAKILIIDERLWQKVTDAEITTWSSDKLNDIYKITEEIFSSQQNKKEQFILFKEKLPFLDEKLLENYLYSPNNITKNELYDFIKKYAANANQIKVQRTFKHDLYSLNKIQIASFILDKAEREYRMYFLPEADGDQRDKHIASINDKGENYSKNHLNLDFDFVLLHQGILDKFTIKNESKLPSTTQLLKIIQNILNQLNKRPIYIIHSGRSKPPPETYPDPLIPFIQYSSVESSFNDCKYTLTELLYSAININ